MTTTYTYEQLNSAFDNLPESIQDTIMSTETQEVIEAIIYKYDIHKDEAQFRKLIFALCIGVMSPVEFVAAIQREMNVETEDSEDVLLAIDSSILQILHALAKQELGNPDRRSPVIDPTNSEKEHGIKEHLLDEIENPTPSPMVSTPKDESAIHAHIPTPELQNLPAARVIPPLAPITVPNYSPARELPKIIKKEESKTAPTSILLQQLETPTHNLDHEPNIPEHDEDLMPLIIETSRNAQLPQTQSPPAPAAPVETPVQPTTQTSATAPAPKNTPGSDKRYTDPYREPIV